MQSPVLNKINTIFVHVSNLERSVKWYCQLLDQPFDSNLIERPVYNIQINDYTGLTLDAGQKGTLKEIKATKYPLFNFHTHNIDESFFYVKDLGFTIETDIVRFDDFAYFTISDPDDNHIMICTG
jgi:predicted enzyme related to lactoylglutathione lyase